MITTKHANNNENLNLTLHKSFAITVRVRQILDREMEIADYLNFRSRAHNWLWIQGKAENKWLLCDTTQKMLLKRETELRHRSTTTTSLRLRKYISYVTGAGGRINTHHCSSSLPLIGTEETRCFSQAWSNYASAIQRKTQPLSDIRDSHCLYLTQTAKSHDVFQVTNGRLFRRLCKNN